MILLELVYAVQIFWQSFHSDSSYLKASVLWKQAENMTLHYCILNLGHRKNLLKLTTSGMKQ